MEKYGMIIPSCIMSMQKRRKTMNKKNQAKKFAKKATALATVFGMAAS